MGEGGQGRGGGLLHGQNLLNMIKVTLLTVTKVLYLLASRAGYPGIFCLLVLYCFSAEMKLNLQLIMKKNLSL